MIMMLKKFLNLAGEKKKTLYLAWVFQILTSICEGSIYFTLFYVIRDILAGSFSRSSVTRFGIAFTIYTVLHFVFYYFNVVKQRPASYAIMRDERLHIAEKIKQFPLYYFSKDKISQLTSLFTTDLTFVETSIMEVISGFISCIVMTTIFSIMLLSVDLRMALLLMVGIIPGLLLYRNSQKKMVANGALKKEAQTAMLDTTLEYVQGMETIKAYQMNDVNAVVETQVDTYCDTSDQYEPSLTNWSTVYKLALNIGIFLSLGVGIIFLQNNSLSADTYLFFAIMGIIYYRPLESLMDSFAVLSLSNDSLDNITEFHNVPTESVHENSQAFTARQAAVRFEHVSFGYDNKKSKALNDISFAAAPGTVTALVGPSGSGKTTLLNMIPNFLTAQSGDIYINDKNISTIRRSDLIRHISIVFQEVYLFQDTMLNNIRMGNRQATEQQVIEAAKEARCHEFIEKLPESYQTVVSEGEQICPVVNDNELLLPGQSLKMPRLYCWMKRFQVWMLKMQLPFKVVLNR